MRQINKSQPSRRAFLRTAAQAALLTGLAGCIPAHAFPTPSPPLPAPLRPGNSFDILLAQKIGQMIMVGFAGRDIAINSRIVQDIRDSKIGGVVLVGPNIESPAQVQQLTGHLQGAAPHPLLIAVDQEGGRVRRLDARFGITINYSARQLGTLNDLITTTRFANTAAKTLHGVGINLNLAPVVDLNVNPNNPIIGVPGRSFSAKPEIVTRHSLAFIKAHHQEGILCTLKHFPGHGSSTADSHKGLVDVTESWGWQELEPFAQIIEQDRCDIVMTAHIFNGNIDPDLPATLSKPTISGLLRGDLGYDGVIVTDDLEMAAIRQFYDFEEAVELAINAGVDIFLSSHYIQASIERTIATVVNLVENGKIPMQRIDDSFSRIQALKGRIGQRVPVDSPLVPEEEQGPTSPNGVPDVDKPLEDYLL